MMPTTLTGLPQEAELACEMLGLNVTHSARAILWPTCLQKHEDALLVRHRDVGSVIAV